MCYSIGKYLQHAVNLSCRLWRAVEFYTCKIVNLWMTIRGFSIVSRLLEDYEASQKYTTAKKALRKQLITVDKLET